MVSGDLELSCLGGYLRICAEDYDPIAAHLDSQKLKTLGLRLERSLVGEIEFGDYALARHGDALDIVSNNYSPVTTRVPPRVLEALGLQWQGAQ